MASRHMILEDVSEHVRIFMSEFAKTGFHITDMSLIPSGSGFTLLGTAWSLVNSHPNKVSVKREAPQDVCHLYLSVSPKILHGRKW